MQTKTNNLKVWNDLLNQEQFTFLEWQDSFHRNGLSDFCPPMLSPNVNCLVVGEGMTATTPYPSNKLPWEEVAEATMVVSARESQLQQRTTVRTDNSNDSHTAVPVLASTHAAQYDCILDQGLMEAVLLAAGETTRTAPQPHQLIYEASTALREHGVYVLVTTQSLNKNQQRWLVESGQEVGLEWEFHLDGISDPEKGQVVSVGRRFNAGSMPCIGKLSRYQI